MLQRNFPGAFRFLMIRRSRLYCSMRTSHTRPRRWTFTSPSQWERWARLLTASRPCRSRCTSRCPGLTTGCQWSTNTRPGVRAPQVGRTSTGNSIHFVANKMITFFTLEDSSFFVTQLSSHMFRTFLQSQYSKPYLILNPNVTVIFKQIYKILIS